jgi:3-phosphoshikimate 1-carboxyvinyltransferase
MIEALGALGFSPRHDQERECVRLAGGGGAIAAASAAVDAGNAGTVMRSLAAACCLGHGAYELDGDPRMRQRPIGQLVEALRSLGAHIEYIGADACPPLRIIADGLRGGTLSLGGVPSSQFITALLLAGPCMRDGLMLHLSAPLISRPYVRMTVNMMSLFGIEVQVNEQFTSFVVAPGTYRGCDLAIEPDASAATYFMAAAAIIDGSRCTLEGLGRKSLQGDVAFAEVLHAMGAGLVFGGDFVTVMAPAPGQRLRGIDVDMNHLPDAALTLAAIAPLCEGETAIRNVGNLRFKETDRLAALHAEMSKVGARPRIEGDDLLIEPPPDGKILPSSIATYDDHRMAMSFAVLGLAAKGIVIEDPACVNKTFPDFFGYLERLGAFS